MKKILFVYFNECESTWRDGLYKALELLGSDYEITKYNMASKEVAPSPLGFDFVLGWGAFGSQVDELVREMSTMKGLCIAGNARQPVGCERYDVLFYETEWYRPQIAHHFNIVHAFGVNTDIFKPMFTEKHWKYITVGAFADWKRHYLLGYKVGNRLAVGQIQVNNLAESMRIVAGLLRVGVMVSDQLPPEEVAKLYNMSEVAYIPCDVVGGGERSVLEARACGTAVEVEDDNPKLKELLTSPIWDYKYYYQKLKEGIEGVL